MNSARTSGRNETSASSSRRSGAVSRGAVVKGLFRTAGRGPSGAQAIVIMGEWHGASGKPTFQQRFMEAGEELPHEPARRFDVYRTTPAGATRRQTRRHRRLFQ